MKVNNVVVPNLLCVWCLCSQHCVCTYVSCALFENSLNCICPFSDCFRDDDGDEEESEAASKAKAAAKNTKKLTQFFSPPAGAAKKVKPHRFFDERRLQAVATL